MSFAQRVDAQRQEAGKLLDSLFPPQLQPRAQLAGLSDADRDRRLAGYSMARDNLTSLGSFQCLRGLLEKVRDGSKGRIDPAVPLALLNAADQKRDALLVRADLTKDPTISEAASEFNILRLRLQTHINDAMANDIIFRSGLSQRGQEHA